MTIITKTKFLEFKSAKSPSNHDWYYVRRTNDTNKHDSAVVITTVVNINNKNNFLLLKTKRPPMYNEDKCEFSIESPAGLIGDINKNEDLLECAKKELIEEAGIEEAKLFFEQKNCSTSNGLSSETLSFVSAFCDEKNITKTPQSDGGIIVERFFVETDKINDFIFNLDPKKYSLATATIAGIYFALNRIKAC